MPRAIDAGADLVEVNTGLVYSGPGIAHRMQTRILAS